MRSKTRRFRRLIGADEILQPRIYHGFGTRLVQQMGCESAAIAGAGLGKTILGRADVGLTKIVLAVLLQSVAEGHVIEPPDLAVSLEEWNELMGITTIRAMEQRFVTAAQREAKYGTAR